MKLLFLLLGCVFGATAFAQISDEELKAKIKNAIIKKTDENKKTPFAFKKLNLDTSAHSHVFVAGQKVAPGVYRLKQDGMPCIVPDTKEIAHMPNAFGTVAIPFKARIPNAWKKQAPALPPTDSK